MTASPTQATARPPGRWILEAWELRVALGLGVLLVAGAALVTWQPRHLQWWFFEHHSVGPPPALVSDVVRILAHALLATGVMRVVVVPGPAFERVLAALACVAALALVAVSGDAEATTRLVCYGSLGALLAIRARRAHADVTTVAAVLVVGFVALLAAGVIAQPGDALGLAPELAADFDPWTAKPRPWLYASAHAFMPLALATGFLALWRRRALPPRPTGVLPAASASLTLRGVHQAGLAIGLKLILGGLTGLAWVFWHLDAPSLLKLSALLAVLAIPLSALLISAVGSLLQAELGARRVSLRTAQALLAVGLIIEILFVASVFLQDVGPVRTNVAVPNNLVVVGIWLLMPAISVVGWLGLGAFLVWTRRLAADLGRDDIARAVVQAGVWLTIGVGGTGVMLSMHNPRPASPFHHIIDTGGPLPPPPAVWLGVALAVVTVWGMISVTLVVTALRDHIRGGVQADRLADEF